MTKPLGYLVKQETIDLAGTSFQLHSLLDRNQFYDPLQEAERAGIPPAAWPLFGVLWPSGQVLAHAMLGFDIAGKRVLELGCGLALASLVVHRRGGDITASDNHPLAGEFLLENLRLNGLPPMPYATGNWGRANPALGLFDLIIGSDVLYDRGQPQALADFIAQHASAHAEVLIADPDRGNVNHFTRCMQALGYAHDQRRITTLPGGAQTYKGRLHHYRRGGDSEICAIS